MTPLRPARFHRGVLRRGFPFGVAVLLGMLALTARGAIAAGASLTAGIVDVAAGSSHSVALSADGTMWTTGYNSSSQLGDGTTAARNNFTPVMSGVVRVKGGVGSTLFIKTDRTLWFVGYNQGGAFGGTNFANFPTPTQIATDVVDVAAAQNHSLILKSDGSLWAVGGNYDGQLGNGGTPARVADPIHVADDVKAIAADDTYSLFVKADGTLWGMGNNTVGQIGGTSFSSALVPRIVATNVTSVSAAARTNVFVKGDGTVWGLGYNASKQITSAGQSGSNNVPVLMGSGGKSAVTSGSHTLVLKTDGSVWANGANFNGQIGNGSFTEAGTPVQVQSGVVRVAAGSGAHSLFLKADGSLTAAGNNSNGQLGDGSNATRSSPVTVLAAALAAPSAPTGLALSTASAGLVRVSCAPVLGATSYALWRAATADSASAVKIAEAEIPLFFDAGATAGSTFYYWVSAVNGAGASALGGGDSATPSVLAPYALAALDDVQVAIGASATFTASVAANPAPSYQWQIKLPGGTWADLSDGAGVAGATTGTLQLTPLDLSLHNAQVRCVVTNSGGTLTTAVGQVRVAIGGAQVADGLVHALVLKQDGSLWATGSNPYGEQGAAGLSSLTYRWVDEGVAGIWAGRNASLFLRSDATLWSAGQDSYGALGGANGANATRSLGTLATDVATAALGRYHTLLLSRMGQLSALGSNGYGQLGDGTLTDRTTPVTLASDVIAVAAGGYHSLFVKADGTLWAAGQNGSGQLGDSTTEDRATPVMVAQDVAAVAAGLDYSFFLKRNGELWGMGQTSGGQLGLGSGKDKIATPQLVATQVAAVAAGSRTAYLVKLDGTLWRTGSYTGAGNLSSYAYTFAQIDTAVAAVTAGEDFAHWVKTDGSVWAYQNNTYGQLGDGTTTARTSPVQVQAGAAVAPTAPTGFTATTAVAGRVRLTWNLVPGAAWYVVLRSSTGDFADAIAIADRVPGGMFLDAQATAGVAHSYWVRAVSPGGSALTTAVTATSAAGLPSLVAQPGDQLVGAGATATFTVGTVANSTVTYQWQFFARDGTSWIDVQDDARISGATTPTLTWSGLTTAEHGGQVRCVVTTSAGAVNSRGVSLRLKIAAAAVAAGNSHSLFLLADGSLWATGDNSVGQLANGGKTALSAPVFVRAGVAQVSAGSSRSFFIDQSGTLWAVGANYYGVLGDGTTTTRPTPVAVATNVSRVSAGKNSHALFVTRDGTLWGMGLNQASQLGDGTLSDHWVPYQIATGVLEASAGGAHTLFVRADGTLWAVGYNGSGQLGDGTTTSRTSPVAVTSGVVAVSAGDSFSLFAKVDGSLWGMGANQSGQLGDGTTTNRPTPILVSNNVVSFAAGPNSSFFVKADGSVWAVGYGPLGNNFPFVQQNQPVQIATDGAAVSIHSGHLLILKRDGSVYATGNNSSGQLGDGTTATRNLPVLVWSGATWPLSAPAGLAMGTASTTVATIAWSPAANGFAEVWRGTDANFANATRLASHVEGFHFIDASATPGTSYRYWVRAIAADGTTATSAPVTAYVGVAPAVTFSPASPSVKAGGSVTFQASASGYPVPSYQWRRNQTPITGATLDHLTLSPLISDDAGDYDVVVTNSVGTATAATTTLTVLPLTGFELWTNAHFSTDELAQPAISGATADADGDGWSNLTEYALATDPQAANGAAPFTISSESGFWTFLYDRPDSVTDVTYEVETSNDLVHWTTADVLHEVLASNAGYTQWRARVATAGHSTCFFRLKVSRVP